MANISKPQAAEQTTLEKMQARREGWKNKPEPPRKGTKKMAKKVVKPAKEPKAMKLTDAEVTRQALAAHFGGPKPKQPVPTGYEGLKRLTGAGFTGASILSTEMTDGYGDAPVGVSVRV